MAAGQMRDAPGAGLDVQRSWDGTGLRAGWASTPDMRFIVHRQTQLAVDLTRLGRAVACSRSPRGRERTGAS